MPLRVVGSGLGRTGTTSLKAALERLLGGACYHMIECFGRPDDPPVWTRAFAGEPIDWDGFLADYVAAVDWPAAACWKDLAHAFPDALVLHSERPASDWFRSADNTIFTTFKGEREVAADDAWFQMAHDMFASRFTPDFLDRAAAIDAYEAWNADVRTSAPPDRLLIWRTGDGWEPICQALDLPVPDEPFPHANTTEDFRKMVGLDEA